jgi:hypothetical protein
VLAVGHGEHGIGEGPAAAKERRHGRACPGHPRGSAQRMTRSELHGWRAVFSKPLLLVAAMSASSLRRRCVDGRDKPGHDGKRSRAQPQGARSTENAIGATNHSDPRQRTTASAPASRRLVLVATRSRVNTTALSFIFIPIRQLYRRFRPLLRRRSGTTDRKPPRRRVAAASNRQTAPLAEQLLGANSGRSYAGEQLARLEGRLGLVRRLARRMRS